METKKTEWCITQLKASASNFKSIKAWQRDQPAAYAAAWRKGVIEECCKHMDNSRRKHTRESLSNIANQHESRSQWFWDDPGSYSSARKKNLLDEVCGHMDPFLKQWSKEECLNSASSHTSEEEWFKDSPAIFDAALKNGWIDECVDAINRNSDGQVQWSKIETKYDKTQAFLITL